jgi:diaminohydroxyphosphoribosylaminopyrimidine deaminase/5-amino-6-(5-phosphoribosylamino)uracil reductase
LLGALFDARLIDEVHVFIAPRVVGGGAAPGPLAGTGLASIADALSLADVRVQQVGPDLYVRGRLPPLAWAAQ